MDRSQTLPALFVSLSLMLPQPVVLAQEAGHATLSAHIPLGLWAFAYQRAGELRPLFWKYQEDGNSEHCIRSDPRQHLLDWIARKGCSVDSERSLTEGYLLSGQCRLKWLPGEAVPVDVRLTWRGNDGFEMEIRSRPHRLLRYRESIHATRLGPCPGQ